MKFPGVFLFLLMSLTGCTEIHEYPKDWSKLKEFSSEDCPNISGIYEECSDASSDFSINSLKEQISCLNPSTCNFETTPCTSDRTVELQQPDSDTFRIIVRWKNNISFQKLYTRSTKTNWNNVRFNAAQTTPFIFECDRNSVVLKMKHFMVVVGQAIYMSNKLSLYQTVSGDLVIKDEQDGHFQWLIIPIPSKTRNWHRWHRVN